MKKIISRIRTLREMKGFSQEYMAEKMNISQKTYSRLESGKTKLDCERLKKISTLLETSPNYILENSNLLPNSDIEKNIKTKHFYNQEYINHLLIEIDFLKKQNERILNLLENKRKFS